MIDERYARLPINQVFPSKTNPRTHFDDHYLNELAASIREKGLVQPILVRESPGKAEGGRFVEFEIIAGECRYRASKLANQTHIAAVIRQYTDHQVLELQRIENIHRRDLTALEQAAGYQALVKADPKKHTPASIAQRIGMSEAWVWDRLKLNDLIPEAKALLEQGKIAAGHGILISRQKPVDQARLINPSQRLLFTHLQHGLTFDGGVDAAVKPGKYDDMKAVSVRELEAAIAYHIRFDVVQAAKAAPLLFGQTSTRVEAAELQPGRGKKVVAITFAHGPSDDAKDASERTYGAQSWRRADGTKKTTPVNSWGSQMKDSPACEYSVLGLVVAGLEHYGETFRVCVNRDKCQVHFGQEITARAKSAKARASGSASKASKFGAQQQAKAGIERQKREAAEARWKVFRPALTKAVHAAANKIPATLPKALYAEVLKAACLPKETKPAGLAQALLQDAIRDLFNDHVWHGDEPKLRVWANLLKVDVQACEPKKPAAAPAKKGS